MYHEDRHHPNVLSGGILKTPRFCGAPNNPRNCNKTRHPASELHVIGPSRACSPAPCMYLLLERCSRCRAGRLLVLSGPLDPHGGGRSHVAGAREFPREGGRGAKAQRVGVVGALEQSQDAWAPLHVHRPSLRDRLHASPGRNDCGLCRLLEDQCRAIANCHLTGARKPPNGLPTCFRPGQVCPGRLESRMCGGRKVLRSAYRQLVNLDPAQLNRVDLYLRGSETKSPPWVFLRGEILECSFGLCRCLFPWGAHVISGLIRFGLGATFWFSILPNCRASYSGT